MIRSRRTKLRGPPSGVPSHTTPMQAPDRHKRSNRLYYKVDKLRIEEAAYGDPGIDVAYCRMDMLLSGLGEAADEFLSVYEAKMGQRVANLELWELAAAARPMFSPQSWGIAASPVKERFSRFITDVRRRADL